MNNYKLKSIGLIEDEVKELTCWAPGAISGSKVNKIFTDADTTLKEDLNIIPKPDLNADLTIREKLKMGNKMEGYIMDLACEEWPEMRPVVIKHTFNLVGTNYYANIDGISADHSIIYEIKNSETNDVEALFERYKWQGIYYCWFFKAKKVVFIFFIRGYKLRRYEYSPVKEDYEELLKKITEFEKAYNEKISDFFQEVKDIREYVLENEDAKKKLARLVEIKKSINELETEDKELRKYFVEALNNTNAVFYDADIGYKIQIQKQTRRGSIDTEKLFSDHPNIPKNLYKKPDYQMTQVRMIEVKNKKETNKND